MHHQKTAVITGSTSAIGSALCRLLLAQDYAIANIDRNQIRALQLTEQLLIEFPQAQIVNVTADLQSLQQIALVCAEIGTHFEHVDLLFHNAGALICNKKMSLLNVEMHFAINCLAPYSITQQLLPLLQRATAPKVILSGSSASRMANKMEVKQLINPDNFKAMSGAYAQSKAAIRILFEHWQQHIKAVQFCVVDLPPTKTKMASSSAMPALLRWFSFLFASPQSSAQKLFNASQTEGAISAAKSTRQQLNTVELVAVMESLQ